MPGRHVEKSFNQTIMKNTNLTTNKNEVTPLNNKNNSRNQNDKSIEVENVPKKNLSVQKNELVKRLKNKIAILEGDKQGIKNEILENEKDLQDIVTIVEKQGSMADADKLKVHVKEVESVTRLRTVLLVREETAQQKIKVTMDAKDKVLLQTKITKLSSQSEEAEKLRDFRVNRGEAIVKLLAIYLDNGKLLQLKSLLDMKEYLVSEECKVEEKIQLGQQQIIALDNSVFL